MTSECVRLIKSIPDKECVEIIVVDDNSTDSIKEIEDCLKKRKCKTVCTVNYTGTKGAGAARNVGLNLAVGEWLLFADADDYYETDMWKKIEPYFITDNDLVFFMPTSRDTVTNKSLDRHKSYKMLISAYLDEPNMCNTNRLKYWWDPVWSKLIKRSVFEKNNIYFENIICSNDVMGSIKSAYYSRNIAVSESIIYCITNRHLSDNSNFIHKKTRLEVIVRKYLFLAERLSTNDFQQLDIERQLLYFVLNYYRKEHNIKETVELWRIIENSNIKINRKFVLKEIIKRGLKIDGER